jgi:hypothetical protein
VVPDVAFPDLKHIISKISLSRFTMGRTEELSNISEESLKMKAANFQWFPTAMDESTNISDTAQLAVFTSGINMEFNTTEELTVLMPMKQTTIGAGLYG